MSFGLRLTEPQREAHSVLQGSTKMEHDKLKEAEPGLRELTADEMDAVAGGKLAGAVHEIFNSGNDVFEKFNGNGAVFLDHNIFA